VLSIPAPCFSPAGCQGLCWKAPLHARYNATVCTRMLAAARPCAGTWHLRHTCGTSSLSASSIQGQLGLQFGMNSCWDPQQSWQKRQLASTPLLLLHSRAHISMLLATLKLHRLQHCKSDLLQLTELCSSMAAMLPTANNAAPAFWSYQSISVKSGLCVSTQRCCQIHTLFRDGYPVLRSGWGPGKYTSGGAENLLAVLLPGLGASAC
jgi:hypothetical protein